MRILKIRPIVNSAICLFSKFHNSCFVIILCMLTFI